MIRKNIELVRKYLLASEWTADGLKYVYIIYGLISSCTMVVGGVDNIILQDGYQIAFRFLILNQLLFLLWVYQLLYKLN